MGKVYKIQLRISIVLLKRNVNLGQYNAIKDDMGILLKRLNHYHGFVKIFDINVSKEIEYYYRNESAEIFHEAGLRYIMQSDFKAAKQCEQGLQDLRRMNAGADVFSILKLTVFLCKFALAYKVEGETASAESLSKSNLKLLRKQKLDFNAGYGLEADKGDENRKKILSVLQEIDGMQPGENKVKIRKKLKAVVKQSKKFHMDMNVVEAIKVFSYLTQLSAAYVTGDVKRTKSLMRQTMTALRDYQNLVNACEQDFNVDIKNHVTGHLSMLLYDCALNCIRQGEFAEFEVYYSHLKTIQKNALSYSQKMPLGIASLFMTLALELVNKREITRAIRIYDEVASHLVKNKRVLKDADANIYNSFTQRCKKYKEILSQLKQLHPDELNLTNVELLNLLVYRANMAVNYRIITSAATDDAKRQYTFILELGELLENPYYRLNGHFGLYDYHLYADVHLENAKLTFEVIEEIAKEENLIGYLQALYYRSTEFLSAVIKINLHQAADFLVTKKAHKKSANSYGKYLKEFIKEDPGYIQICENMENTEDSTERDILIKMLAVPTQTYLMKRRNSMPNRILYDRIEELKVYAIKNPMQPTIL